MPEINIDNQTKESNLFFTTSDLINKINKVVDKEHEKSNDGSENHPRFELQRRFADGTTRKASTEEAAANDFQSKLKQAAMVAQNLPPAAKLEWAETQRQEGNKLFAKGLYEEAIDVYLTCLVAADKDAPPEQNKSDNDETDLSNSSNDNKDTIIETKIGDDDDWERVVEKEVKLPVLLNLSQCTFKLSMHKKTCTFCDLVLEMECGKTEPKVYFRRGRANNSMGMYDDARRDLDMSLKLLGKQEKSEEVIKMEHSVKKEMIKLDTMIESAEKNRARQEKAMKRMLGGKSTDNPTQENTESRDEPNKTKGEEESLYTDVGRKREYSTLRAPRRKNEPNPLHRNRAFVCCMKAAERGLRKILYLLGDEDAMSKSYDSEDDKDTAKKEM